MLKQTINIWKITIKALRHHFRVFRCKQFVWVGNVSKTTSKGFKSVENLSEFNEGFIKKYDEDSNTGYFLKVDVEYPKDLSNSHKDLPFLPERQKVEKVQELVCDTNDKEKYVVHIRALKQALNHGLKLNKVHRVIQFNQKAWLKNTSTRILNQE